MNFYFLVGDEGILLDQGLCKKYIWKTLGCSMGIISFFSYRANGRDPEVLTTISISKDKLDPVLVKKRKFILTESNETYNESSRLQINDMCQTIWEENVYWLIKEHRKTRKSR